MTRKLRVLVVDDEILVSNLLGMLLQKDGYEVYTASNGAQGMKLAFERRPEAIILDIKMPGLDGFEVCRELRKTTDAVILFVSVKGDTQDIVRGMELGADDYLVKPYTYRELASRLKSCLRRKAGYKPPLVLKPSTEIMLLTDPDRRLVFVNGREVQLTPKEFEVLKYMLRHPGRVLSPAAILAYAWGAEYLGSDHLVKQLVYRLRSKLEPDPEEPRYIVTVRGSGYLFETGQAT
jgi:two-component system response regulator RegX3